MMTRSSHKRFDRQRRLPIGCSFIRDTTRRGLIFAVSSFCLALSTSGAAEYRIAPVYSKGVNVVLQCPDGWRTDEKTTPSGTPNYEIVFTPVGSKPNPKIPLLGVTAYSVGTYFKMTQHQRALEYLDGVHRHTDPKVTMERLESFDASRNGKLTIYRFYSEYWHNHYIVWIQNGDLLVQLDLNGEPGSTELRKK